MSSLDFLFRPKTVALIGASHDERKLGGVILKNLLKFKGRLYPVNPKYDSLMGIKSYPSVDEVPEFIDLSLIMRPAEEIPALLKSHKGKARCAVVMSSGFSETGRGDIQDEIKKIGIETGVRILGPNCMGVYNPGERLDTLLLPAEKIGRPKKGNVGVVTQSGAILHCFFGIMKASNIGISKAATYGNAVDIDECDLYEYFSRDRRTDVVISYIESVGDGRRFLEAAKGLSGEKTLLILKAGKGSSGEAAAYSHTGRLAGRYEVFTSLLKQFGIKEVRDFDEMADAVKALSYQRPSKGNRVLIITNGGGSGVLAADECMRQGLEAPPLPPEKTARLKETFPPFYAIHNPLDLTAQVEDGDYLTALSELKDDFDGFVVIALAGVPGITEGLSAMIADFKKKTDRPIVFHTTCGCGEGKLISAFERSGIPVYPSPERAVRAMKALLGER
ncbi:MAG: CoA-binding protein [Thermodesulfovibrionales bacterium]|nr:CoA-binding protein [Thermodesulfovibrionales bacterium]